LDAAGNIYIADIGNARIRRVDTNGTITTVVGNGSIVYNGDGITATNAGLDTQGITVDSAGNLYIPTFTEQTGDYVGGRIRKVDVSQSAVNFSAHTVGTTSPNHRVVVTNTGNQHMDLGALNVTGDFNLLSTGDPSYCSAMPDIGAGFSCALAITFTPTAA